MFNSISVVSTLYYSAPHLEEFCQRIVSQIIKLGFINYEIILVNDGSPDKSGQIANEIADNDSNVSVIHLSRNFGQYNAVFAGLSKARYEIVFVLDCDLEEMPENLEQFYHKLIENPDYDVIYGVVGSRKGGLVKKVFGNVFSSFFDLINDFNIPKDQAWIRLMRKQYVDSLLKFNETETFPAGLFFITGYNQQPLLIQKKYKGYTTYNLSKRLTSGLNAIVSFSSKPLVFIGIFGFIISFAALISLIFLLLLHLYGVNFQLGWLSVVGSIWLVGGIIIFCIGIIGLYISKIFNQIKNRPLFIIKNIYEKELHR
jgi:putative glycosyltransferase